MKEFRYTDNSIILQDGTFQAEIRLDIYHKRKSPRKQIPKRLLTNYKGVRLAPTGVPCMKIISSFMIAEEWAEFRTHLIDDYAIECYNKIERR